VSAPADLVRELFGAYREHDLDRMVTLCAPDRSFEYVPIGGQGRGRIAATGRQGWSSLIDALPT
jgi:ketosteroid isomerase-like protein